MTNKKKLLMKILVPALVVVAIVVLWAVKTHPAASDSDNELVTAENEGDFLLAASSIDLETLTAYGLPIVIDFGSDSCIPCKAMAPVLVTMNEEMQGKAIIKFVDVWKYTEAADDFPIQVIPTQVFINADGTPYVPSDDIDIEFTMYSDKDTGEHVFTVHQGGVTEEEMRAILMDMGVTE
ncbi:MAG: thioredoxin family protein [Oscillibacter sp.]|nr:thioredoxin family protein [Oscillibacter sp.]